MTGLLKSDFRRILKDKLLIVVGILAVVFAITLPLLYAVIFSTADMLATEMLGNMFTAKTLFFSSFSMGNNLGLVAPVLLAIILCKDFSFGTIRNKVIAGKSRSQIFLSLFISCAVVLIVVMLLHAFIALGVSLIFFEYQQTAFTLADFGYFLASLGFEILDLLFVAALLSWLCANMKNVGLVIVLYIAIAMALVLAGSILQTIISVLQLSPGNEKLLSVLEFFNRINIGSASLYIGVGTSYSLKDVLYLVISPVVGIGFFLGYGLLKFNKKDLK